MSSTNSVEGSRLAHAKCVISELSDDELGDLWAWLPQVFKSRQRERDEIAVRQALANHAAEESVNHAAVQSASTATTREEGLSDSSKNNPNDVGDKTQQAREVPFYGSQRHGGRRRSSSRSGNQKRWQVKATAGQEDGSATFGDSKDTAVADYCQVSNAQDVIAAQNQASASKKNVMPEGGSFKPIFPLRARDSAVPSLSSNSECGGCSTPLKVDPRVESESSMMPCIESSLDQDVSISSECNRNSLLRASSGDAPLPSALLATTSIASGSEKPVPSKPESKKPLMHGLDEYKNILSQKPKDLRKSLSSAALDGPAQVTDAKVAAVPKNTFVQSTYLFDEWPDLAKASQIRSRGTSRLRNQSATRQDSSAARFHSQPRQLKSNSSTRGMQPRRDPLAIVWICKECQARFSKQELLAEHQEAEGHWSPTMDCSRTFVRKSDLPSSGGCARDVDSGLAPGTSSPANETLATVRTPDQEANACFFAMSPRGE
mmetsp:Transcript_43206/g.68326  ORF Transcript_43206/g.68326 Transcript_43206/m.68326 type:complete len:489 (-) Transcript_43206:110-1576(-)